MGQKRRLMGTAAALIVAAGLLCLGTAHAIPNPELARNAMESRATEALTIEVTGVWAHPGPETGQVVVSASAIVRGVTRSKANLKVGDSILIVYQRDVAANDREAASWNEKLSQHVVGGVPPEGIPDLVRAGATCKAFLSAAPGDEVSGAVYYPVAAQYSFQLIEPSR